MQREIAGLLEKISPPGSFAVQRSAPAEALRIDVRGVGHLDLPLRPETVSKLRGAAVRSRYGLRDRTVFDSTVRDSWEIPGRRIRIDPRRWNEVLRPLLDEISAGLGLAEGVKLRAELHNMLLYEKGHFFVSHQDSEKGDGMIGTLVVALPSAFRGGEMIVEHHGEVISFRGSRSALQLVAFYADCRHEVRPVTAGARVVLTYILVTSGLARTMPPRIEPRTLEALAAALGRHFATPVPRTFGGAAVPDRLVYLLDHEYTARGLRWDLLKGADAARAAALQRAGERLDCEMFLAQADVHETWECESDDWPRYASRSFRARWNDDDDYDDGDDMDADDGEPVVGDLIDSDIELRNWVAPGSNKMEAISSSVREEELDYTQPSNEMGPFQTEHTGYMGNWGNTLERWYHRAAIVMWPRERSFVIRARASASWALEEVVRALHRKTSDDARQKLEALIPVWPQLARTATKPLMPNALRAAAGIRDPILALQLLSPLPLEGLGPKETSLFVALLSQYGLEWSKTVLSALPTAQDAAHVRWLTRLPRICEELRREGEGGPALARWLVTSHWDWLANELRGAEREPSPSAAATASSALVAPLLAILRCAIVAKADELRESILRELGATTSERRVEFLMELLRAARAEAATVRRALFPLAARCAESIAGRLNESPRAPGDWSIRAELGCACNHCAALHAFLVAPQTKVFEWPLAKEHRAHIHRVIGRHELPVTHHTRRSGRPFTLVLTKREVLFERDAARRKRWTKDLEWLRKLAGRTSSRRS